MTLSTPSYFLKRSFSSACTTPSQFSISVNADYPQIFSSSSSSQCSSGFALSHPAFFPYVLSPDRFAIQFHSVNSYYMLCPQPFLKSLTLFPVPEIHTHKRNNLLNMPIGYIRSTSASTLSKPKTYPFSHKTCSSGWITSVNSTQLPKPGTEGPPPSAPKPNHPPKPAVSKF